ncbi:MAG: hypothetical protein OEW48_18445, partial [Phycisphaerae bacterium]|nr:hypothetical protein [Phycisphaerae bacterium]
MELAELTSFFRRKVMPRAINLKTYLLISVVLVTLWTATASAEVIYVDAGAAPGGDGSSWTEAYIYLQDALSDPYLANGDEIWVAAETYKPDANSAYPSGTGDRYATFYLINGVAIYGGFPAGGGDWEQRDPGTNETILSGDIGMWLNNQDNSYHVVTGNGVNHTAILDGFTITAGNSYDYYENGGGMYNNSNPTVINCTFSGNSAYRGGGMYNEYSYQTVINCTFSGNSAVLMGGGMCNDHSSPMVINCIFSGNSAYRGGGMRNYNSSPTVTDCTFSGNSADLMGGGMSNYYSSPTLINCILWGNIAPEPDGPQIANLTNAALSISYSDLQGGQAAIHDPCGALVWGAGNIDADPLFMDSDGPDNIVGTPDDNLRLSSSSPCIDAGNNTAVPPDTSDLDGDGNITERTPFDLEGNNRFVDDPGTPDSGYGAPPVVDMGAYEYQIAVYLLTVSSNSGGSVTTPGEGIFEYEYGEVVSIVAEAEEHYQFVEWTGTAVDAGKVANPVAESTTVTMTSDYTLAANFAEAGYLLAVSSNSGGSVTTPGEGIFEYEYGEVVSIVAEADEHYQFVEWTGTAVDAGKVANPIAESTTVTMTSDYTLAANFAEAGVVIYVDIDAGGANNGTSWENAYNYLQDALVNVTGGVEIRVAAGTYYPDESTANPEGTNNRSDTFELINGVAIKGGYAGWGEPDSGVRNIKVYKTILSGDIGTPDVDTDNSYHVVTDSGTDPNAILDGFT